MGAHRTGFRFRPNLDRSDPALRNLVRQGVWAALFLAMTQVLLAAVLAAGWMPGPTPRPIRLALGDGHLVVLVHEAAAPGPVYLSLHDDEDTAVEAVLETLPRRGGRFLEVRHRVHVEVALAFGDEGALDADGAAGR